MRAKNVGAREHPRSLRVCALLGLLEQRGGRPVRVRMLGLLGLAVIDGVRRQVRRVIEDPGDELS